jgi:hypothetical protein
MPHTIVYNSELHIIESKLQGDMTSREVDQIITETAKIAISNDCRLIFTDFTEVSRKLSILEIYELPDRIRNIFTSLGIHISLCKRANLVSKDWDDYVFHENVMVNRGHNEKVFTDVDKAKKWLIGNNPSEQSQLCPCSDGYYPYEPRL